MHQVPAKQHFKSKIVVKDLDILRIEHIKKTYNTSKNWNVDEVKYQKYIDEFIIKQKKSIVSVGLNDNILGTKNIYYREWNIKGKLHTYILF